MANNNPGIKLPQSDNLKTSAQKSADETYFGLKKFPDYITGEVRALNAKYADPLTLCFKLLIDFDKPTGLFATGDHMDTALNYLNRIGQKDRASMLSRWIDMFKIFVKDFDFLLEEVEGLDIIQNKEFGHMFQDTDKVSITVRETTDMMFQSLLSTYRHIVFDDIRCVEILPRNLLSFNASILVYSAGYYNMLLYDQNEVNPDYDVEKMIFPTLRKLGDNSFSSRTMEEFNHQLYIMNNCTINNEDSGRPFAANVSNHTSSDFVTNNLTFNFRFASYKGRFNNIMGDFDFVGFLAIASAQNRISNFAPEDKVSTKITVNGTKQKLVDYLKNTKNQALADAKNIKPTINQLKKDAISTLETRANALPNKFLSKNSVVGNLMSKFTVKNVSNLVKNTFDLGIDFVEDKFVNNPLTKLNNMLFNNFSNDLYGIYKDNFASKNSNVELIENKKAIDNTTTVAYIPTLNGNVEKGVKFGESKVFYRKGF